MIKGIRFIDHTGNDISLYALYKVKKNTPTKSIDTKYSSKNFSCAEWVNNTDNI